MPAGRIRRGFTGVSRQRSSGAVLAFLPTSRCQHTQSKDSLSGSDLGVDSLVDIVEFDATIGLELLRSATTVLPDTGAAAFRADTPRLVMLTTVKIEQSIETGQFLHGKRTMGNVSLLPR